MPDDKAKRTIWGERRKRFMDRVIVTSIIGMILTVIGGVVAIVILFSSLDYTQETEREIMEVYSMCMHAKDNHADCVEWALEQVD